VSRFSWLKRRLAPLVETPFHPQWLVARARRGARDQIAAHAVDFVIDIGCGNRQPPENLPHCRRYLALDYPPTVALGYTGVPHVFGDAQCLPFSSNVADTVLLLDVLEHIPDPERALAEAVRVLRAGGTLVIQVPFLYPLHDAPHDYSRWTIHGLRALMIRNHLRIRVEGSHGSDIETATALTVIAVTKSAIVLTETHPAALLLMPLWAVLIPLINITGWLFDKLLSDSGFMPLSYHVVAQKPISALEGALAAPTLPTS